VEALLDLTGFAEGFVANHTYVGAFLVLVLCGFGFPIPEEVTIIGSGILLHKGVVDPWLIGVACFAGVLVGDAVPYTVGRLWGDQAFDHRWVRRVLHKRRMERMEARMRRHLNLGVFSCRFFPGLRWPGYFIAGHLKMPVWKWLALDATGAAIIVPIGLYLGVLFGANTEKLAHRVEDLNLVLAFAAFAILATVVVRSRVLSARAKAEAETAREEAGAAAEALARSTERSLAGQSGPLSASASGPPSTPLAPDSSPRAVGSAGEPDRDEGP
jgi:membrane protein DedA with SNARE-associated domain